MSDSVYAKLSRIDVSGKVEKKGGFNYLSWADAITFLLDACPEATWEVVKDGSLPYFKTEFGIFVEVAVTVGGITRRHVHPVLDHRNKTIEAPNAFDINTSLARCLTKAIALHGLGLNVYRGEDLPPSGDAPPASRPPATSAPRSAPASSSVKMASEPQLNMIRAVAAQKNVPDPTNGKPVPMSEASAIIKKLKAAAVAPKPAEPAEKPPCKARTGTTWCNDVSTILACANCGCDLKEGDWILVHHRGGKGKCEGCGVEWCMEPPAPVEETRAAVEDSGGLGPSENIPF